MDTEITLKFVGYARKSSEDNKERQAASLPDQVFILEGMKSKQNLNLKEILQESQSAHKPGRPKFEELLSRIEKKEVNAITTWHPNRLARNMADGGRIIDLMDRNLLVEIRTPSRVYRNTPEDKFMLTIEFGISKKDSDDKSIVVRRGLEKKLRDGWRPGWAPLGYLNDKGTESGFRRIYVDQERLPFVKRIFELFLAGTPATEILRMSHKEWHLTTLQRKRIGGKPLSLSELYRILNNPFYCGRFEYPEGSGHWYENNPLLERAVSEEVFNQVQVKLGNISQYYTKHNYTYSGLMKCGICASGVVVDGKWQVICSNCKAKFQITNKNKDHCTKCGTLISEMTDPKILHYIYHRCGRKKDRSCRELSISEKELERQVDERLSEVELNPYFLEWAVKQITKMHEEEKSFREDTIEATKLAHDDCRRKLDNLVALKISPANSDGSMLSDEEFKSRKLPLEAELKSIEKQLVNIDERMIQANDDTVRAVTFCTRAKEKFDTATDSRVKRDIFLGLGLHLTLRDKRIDFDAPLYFEKIEEMKSRAPIIGSRVAPEEMSVDITKTEAFAASIPTLLRGWELNPVWKIMHLFAPIAWSVGLCHACQLDVHMPWRIVSTDSLQPRSRRLPRNCPIGDWIFPIQPGFL